MKRALPTLVLAVCATVFAAGLWHLFELRFEAGDVYPPYSSLRADPLGTMALYESLERLPGRKASRDLQAANRLPEGKGTTYLHLAATPRAWERLPEDVFREVERFLFDGGRLVITFFPETSERFRPGLEEETEAEAPKPDKSGEPKQKKPKRPARKRTPLGDEEATPLRKPADLKAKWGVTFGFVKLEQGDDALVPATVTNRSDLALPASVSWHSGAVLTGLAKNWRVIYARDGQAVVAERAFGRGSVVLATDSFFLSNEALRSDRQAALLAWLVGPNRRVVFDEAHLGVTEQGGLVALGRKYRLHAFAAALLVLAGLFLWQNLTSFVPVYAEERAEGFVTGRESAAGFVSLLRRSIPARDLLAVCGAEWKRACSLGVPAAKLEQVQAILDAENALAPHDRDPVTAYGKIREILTRKTVSAKSP